MNCQQLEQEEEGRSGREEQEAGSSAGGSWQAQVSCHGEQREGERSVGVN